MTIIARDTCAMLFKAGRGLIGHLVSTTLHACSGWAHLAQVTAQSLPCHRVPAIVCLRWVQLFIFVEKSILKHFLQLFRVINDFDLQAARGAAGNFFSVHQLINSYDEAVTAWAWVRKRLAVFIELHVFDFNIIVNVGCRAHDAVNPAELPAVEQTGPDNFELRETDVGWP